MAPLISIGRNRTLQEEDVWFLGYQFQHKRLHEKFRRLRGSVISRLLQANGIDIFILTITATLEVFCELASPVLLQQLLRSMENPHSSKRAALTYALLMFVSSLINAQSQVLALWYGRRCYERSRGEMIMMIYEKTLKRKNIVGPENKGNEKRDEVSSGNDNSDGGTDAIEPGGKKTFSMLDSLKLLWKHKSPTAKSKEPASMGKILNLLRGDVYELAQRFWEIEPLVKLPLGLVFATVLIWKILGPSCLVGIIVVLIAQVVNALITRLLIRWQRALKSATDVRLQVTSQFIEALRHLRWYGWQNHWLEKVMTARQRELHVRIIMMLFTTLIHFVNSFASGMLPVAGFYAYTLLAGHPLRIDIIFPALQIFTSLEFRLRAIPNLVPVFLNAYVSLERIEDFMLEPDKQQTNTTEGLAGPMSLELVQCTFAWPGSTSPVLRDINLKFEKGLTVVCGKVGAGKTALLQALLGELDKLSGVSHIPNEMMGYCSQTPWLQSMSIRDNILFSSPYDEVRYKEVLDACALLQDLVEFKNGDLSFIGENGIGLSGGQKARVALARAIYSRASILVLDDPISALDHNTAEALVRKCFSGPLMKDRTIILVTHRTELLRHMADQVVEIADGRATVSNRDALSTNGAAAGHGLTHDPETEQEGELDQDTSAIPEKFIDEEYRAEWGVKASVYWTYLKAGKLKWWAVFVLGLTVARLLSIGESWFLKEWAEAYGSMLDSGLMFGVSEPFWSQTVVDREYVRFWNPIDKLPLPATNVRPWLLLLFLITTTKAVATSTIELTAITIIYCASKQLFGKVMVRVSRATFRFYDVTPIGRLMNRLTSDLATIDGAVSQLFMAITLNIVVWVSSVIVIASVTPIFLVFSLALTSVFVLTFLHFLPTSQSLRRLETVSLSPLLSNFGELLHGLTTVRAFHAGQRFQNRVISVVDKFQGMDHFYWSLQGWLMYRFANLSAVSMFLLTILALYTHVSPGLTAFVLIAAHSFVMSTHGLCRRYGELQMGFVSVERIDELLRIDEEPTGTVEPPASWPIYGSDIVFDNVTLRYAPHLDPSLTDITLRIPGGSATAIVGRTGSGKSTLALALLAVLQPAPGNGTITIDGQDLSRVATSALRDRITFVAQDPVLFAGTIRHNLDPTHAHSDAACAAVLARLCARHGWTLTTPVLAGGRNLSQGQRQLVGLARAVLRRSSVVVLDEATASIDYASADEIQCVLREEMGEATVITIAHRVEAVRGADWCVVLDKGRVVRQGPAGETMVRDGEMGL
jgi:ABC-type multidrug transport system fused ATPase/permease subunit